MFVLTVLPMATGWAQVLQPALKQALSVEAAMAAIGARTAEPSTFLLLGLPDVAVAGKVKASLASEMAGTSWLILLRGKAGQPVTNVPGQPPTPVLLGAWPFPAGARARATLRIELQATESFTLLAFTRGRWFSVERQVKLGLPVEVARAAKEARARKVREVTAKPVGAATRLQAAPDVSAAEGAEDSAAAGAKSAASAASAASSAASSAAPAASARPVPTDSSATPSERP